MINIQKIFSIILISIFIFGYQSLINVSTAQLITVHLGEPFKLKINQEALIMPENINIKFSTVEEDSRCPLDTQCVWPGQVNIVVNIINQNQNLGAFNLISRLGEKNIQYFDNYGVELIKVTPWPQKNERLEMSDYQAILVVNEFTL
ncbi:hypothetical protein cce_0961 [Crocosphaera subtropica ATCC 51142]|uniref:Uncharacterized protein n=1 Tax=Crocosphaera subtropica (strain ATCC 51142 / BH68) TaxID=43989 RepID=B1WSY2_CROS5|nr:hypothetical protein [Crocosphaera subtropica]ACB50312.1 hypothetical protein cce_0961 [Crocosphaera subtropica ATCC 51142]